MKCKGRETEGVKGRQRSSISCLAPEWPGVGQVEVRNPELPHGLQGPEHLDIFYNFLKCIRRELDQSSWAWAAGTQISAPLWDARITGWCLTRWARLMGPIPNWYMMSDMWSLWGFQKSWSKCFYLFKSIFSLLSLFCSCLDILNLVHLDLLKTLVGCDTIIKKFCLISNSKSHYWVHRCVLMSF